MRNPALTPRCGRPAGPVAKLAALGQRDRTSPGEPSSLGESEGNANRRVVGWPEINSNRNPYERDLAAAKDWELSVDDVIAKGRCTRETCRYPSLRLSERSKIANISSGLKGLIRKSFIPAAMQRALSSANALAVMAMIGVSRYPGS